MTDLRRKSGPYVLVLVPLLGAIGYLWYLHTPNPRVKTPVLLNRNSLLPHRFAGACMNCHKIQEVGPVQMNRNNMNLFKLTPVQQRLLMHGQQVQVPTTGQLLRMPAILRGDILPHPFVGVCSNCHEVLNIRPSAAYMAKAMRRAYQPLTGLGLPSEQIARGGVLEKDQREFWRNFWGFVALVLFAFSCVYVGMRMLIASNAQLYKGKFDLKKWFKVHEWCSTAFCLAAILHWYFSDRGNNYLHVSLLLVIWLTLAGYVLRYRFAEKAPQKNIRLLHTQRIVFYGLIVLLIFGHFFAEFH